ncbi:MAG: thiamine diphosphokinase [Kosmotoga sp.]|uniref:thiamine diphosphokinase n=1 Tax=Kosmotoga sp. TaxID=1955248 RepID=UPI001DA6807E|nr:thiamine diphosphokinase [Kosmotoga sp.]MBO8165881.1 thiamine diphosphokinase [Kosmotoga sp.]
MKTAVVFLGGKKDSSDVFLRKVVGLSSYVVAVDSGAEYLRELNIIPDLLIGDLDSIDPETLNWCLSKKVKVIKFSHDKDETDTELALKELASMGFESVLLLTAMGEREDHFLATLLLLLQFSRTFELKILSERLEIGLVYGYRTLPAVPSETWSIFPLGESIPRVTLKGFKYELNAKKMPFEKPFGVSNIALKNEVEITAEEGKVVYFRWLKRPL